MRENERNEDLPPELADALRDVAPRAPENAAFWQSFSRDVRVAIDAARRRRRRWLAVLLPATAALAAAALVLLLASGKEAAPTAPTASQPAPAEAPLTLSPDVEIYELEGEELEAVYSELGDDEDDPESPYETVQELSDEELEIVLLALTRGA